MGKAAGLLGVGIREGPPIMDEVKGGGMAGKTVLDKMSIYIRQDKLKQRPVERLKMLGEKRDRSVNYLVVDAILRYLAREEKK